MGSMLLHCVVRGMSTAVLVTPIALSKDDMLQVLVPPVVVGEVRIPWTLRWWWAGGHHGGVTMGCFARYLVSVVMSGVLRRQCSLNHGVDSHVSVVRVRYSY